MYIIQQTYVHMYRYAANAVSYYRPPLCISCTVCCICLINFFPQGPPYPGMQSLSVEEAWVLSCVCCPGLPELDPLTTSVGSLVAVQGHQCSGLLCMYVCMYQCLHALRYEVTGLIMITAGHRTKFDQNHQFPVKC